MQIALCHLQVKIALQCSVYTPKTTIPTYWTLTLQSASYSWAERQYRNTSVCITYTLAILHSFPSLSRNNVNAVCSQSGTYQWQAITFPCQQQHEPLHVTLPLPMLLHRHATTYLMAVHVNRKIPGEVQYSLSQSAYESGGEREVATYSPYFAADICL